jgi:hypothetical protein
MPIFLDILILAGQPELTPNTAPLKKLVLIKTNVLAYFTPSPETKKKVLYF